MTGKLDDILTEIWRLLITLVFGFTIRGLRKLIAAARDHFARVNAMEERIERTEKLLRRVAKRLGVEIEEQQQE